MPADQDSIADATLVLRRRATADQPAATAAQSDAVLSADDLAKRYGASPADLDLVTSTCADLGLRIIEADAASRRVRISGTIRQLGTIFGTTIEQVTSHTAGGTPVTHRHRTGQLSIPETLDGVVTAVLGLDDRPQSRANFRIASAKAVTTSYTPLELGAVYRFPEHTDGAGQAIAIIELGGGFTQDDLDAYFAGIGIAGPTVTSVGVDGATNQPGEDPDGADGEVLLDIEVSGALAPAAEIRVYFAPNTDAGFVDAVSQAAHATPTPAAISISWGQSEDGWTAQARTALDDAFTDAALLGVSVTAAAGDDGSSDRAADHGAHVDFPASSPHALGCGGTRLTANPTTGTVSAETVWNNGPNQGATGGGVSTAFGLPQWQTAAGVPVTAGWPGRGVPDVAGNADPQTGYRVRVDGKDTVIGGTSAVAPLWAALVARLVQSTGRRLGLLHPLLYDAIAAGTVAPGFRDITDGTNGAYAAGPGWDACTGLGVPDGAALLAAIKAHTAGGR
ncbi:MAG: S53 family peptidase [Microbacteriaceae bacterium]